MPLPTASGDLDVCPYFRSLALDVSSHGQDLESLGCSGDLSILIVHTRKLAKLSNVGICLWILSQWAFGTYLGGRL